MQKASSHSVSWGIQAFGPLMCLLTLFLWPFWWGETGEQQKICKFAIQKTKNLHFIRRNSHVEPRSINYLQKAHLPTDQRGVKGCQCKDWICIKLEGAGISNNLRKKVTSDYFKMQKRQKDHQSPSVTVLHLRYLLWWLIIKKIEI